MGNSGAQVGGIQSVAPADTTIVVTGSPAVTVKANVGTAAGTVAAGNDARFGKIGGVTVTGTPANGQIPIATGPTAAAWGNVPGGTGTGDVVGPAGATSGNIALFDGTTGKLIKDAGVPPAAPSAVAGAALGAAAAGTSTAYARADHVHPKPTPADIGAQPAGSYATATQGAKADTALQPAVGIVVVNHGTNAATARPAGVAVVYWIGTVAPTNAVAGDLGYGW